MAMFIPLFFRKAKPRSFNYRPVFYDPKRELQDERLRKSLQGDVFAPSIRKGSFNEFHSQRHRKRRKSNFRILITVVLFILISIILLLL